MSMPLIQAKGSNCSDWVLDAFPLIGMQNNGLVHKTVELHSLSMIAP